MNSTKTAKQIEAIISRLELEIVEYRQEIKIATSPAAKQCYIDMIEAANDSIARWSTVIPAGEYR